MPEEPSQVLQDEHGKVKLHPGPDTCDCGEQQTMQRLLVCPHLPSPVTADDLAQANYTTLQSSMIGRTPSRKGGHDEEEPSNT